ncbi:MAG: SMC-Scp complex subunit ScpB [candidate division WOR-3 bacterium]
MKQIIEALLIATDTPLSLTRMAQIINCSEEEVKKNLEALNEEYRQSGRAFEIKEVAGGYQIYTLPEYADYVGKLKQKKEKLSKAALETLAIIAYHQPITRAEIEKTRGVDCSYILESLLEKKLIKVAGRLPTPGRPIKYVTTDEFLRHFGIKDLSELPREEDFAEPAIETPPSFQSAQEPVLEEKQENLDEAVEEEFKDLTD